jgi:tRNA U34 5-carboxymethylaminomethyl modifying GTPase MnmE/TrmE
MVATVVRTDDSRLEALAELAVAVGAEHLIGEVQALGDRVRDGLFYVACVGQFKRGKSTLLNAIVGERILPSGVVPVTAVVTLVRHGEDRHARIRYATGGWQDVAVADLPSFVTEEQNPENGKGVAAVEVFVPSELLTSGMCLVDTPGIGSVFLNNTEATRAFVPHVDAALVVLGADPPISAEELALVKRIAKQCEEILFVLNKADRLAEPELEEARRFTGRILAQRAGLDGVRLLDVSATERLGGEGPARDWPGLIEALGMLAEQSSSHLVGAAQERGLARLADRLRLHLDEQRAALSRPIEESVRRVRALRECLGDAERALSDLSHLFLAEQERLRRDFEHRRERFVKRALPSARREPERVNEFETADYRV